MMGKMKNQNEVTQLNCRSASKLHFHHCGTCLTIAVNVNVKINVNLNMRHHFEHINFCVFLKTRQNDGKIFETLPQVKVLADQHCLLSFCICAIIDNQLLICLYYCYYYCYWTLINIAIEAISLYTWCFESLNRTSRSK